MTEPELLHLAADGWREFRDVRLASLADSPGAFGSRHAGLAGPGWLHRRRSADGLACRRAEGAADAAPTRRRMIEP